MRNILMTVMLLMVVVFLFVNIITSDTGISQEIVERGNKAAGDIEGIGGVNP